MAGPTSLRGSTQAQMAGPTSLRGSTQAQTAAQKRPRAETTADPCRARAIRAGARHRAAARASVCSRLASTAAAADSAGYVLSSASTGACARPAVGGTRRPTRHSRRRRAHSGERCAPSATGPRLTPTESRPRLHAGGASGVRAPRPAGLWRPCCVAPPCVRPTRTRAAHPAATTPLALQASVRGAPGPPCGASTPCQTPRRPSGPSTPGHAWTRQKRHRGRRSHMRPAAQRRYAAPCGTRGPPRGSAVPPALRSWCRKRARPSRRRTRVLWCVSRDTSPLALVRARCSWAGRCAAACAPSRPDAVTRVRWNDSRSDCGHVGWRRLVGGRGAGRTRGTSVGLTAGL